MGKFGAAPQPKSSELMGLKITKALRTGTAHFENLELKGLPPMLMALDISQCMMIKEIYLEDNNLATLPEEFGRFFNIYELRLMNNRLVTLPDSIGALTKLQLLFLRNNAIASIPGTIGNCEALSTVQLSHNPLAELPSEMGTLSKLRDLDLENTPQLRIPPEEVRLRGLKATQSFLRSFHNAKSTLCLDLPELGLYDMPNVGHVQGLTSIVMLSNKIAYLGPSIVRSYFMQRIDLADNEFQQFPTEVTCFQDLIHLDLNFNKLESLPHTFRVMTRLLEFRLSHNFCREIPPAIGELRRMVKFVADDNFFTKIPDEIKACVSLTAINLNSNQLKTLPD
eukprot:2686146-Rhodomonas_salina.2